MKLKKLLFIFPLIVILLSSSIIGVAAEDSEDSFNNSTLGIVTGSLYDGYSRNLFPNAKIEYYNTFADLFQCVKQGKIDAFMLDEASFNAVQRSDDRLHFKVTPEYTVDLGFGFQRNDGGDILQAQMNDLLKTLDEEGKLEALIDKWYGTKEPVLTLFMPDFSDNPTPITIAIDTTRKPFVYLLNNQPAGFEIEVMYLFCETYGYKPTFTDVPFASGLAGLAAEKYDMVCGGLYMTAERKLVVNFSDSYMSAKVGMVTYKDESEDNFLDLIYKEFTTTMVKEDRWKLIVSGMWTTFLISLSSIVLGSILGFGIFFGKQANNRISSIPCRLYSKVCSFVLHGTPTLVLLMFLYYAVFGNTTISGTIVSVFGFTLIFASFVEMSLTRCTQAIDPGQWEAAYALGYEKNRTLFKFILPQSMKLFLPQFTEEMILIVKATSVVGYIAVSDLTKMADIIRNNTYIALFPLLAATACYFLLTWGITLLLRHIQKVVDPMYQRQRRLSKGKMA